MIHRNDKTFMCSIQVLISKWAKIWGKKRASFEASKGIKKIMVISNRKAWLEK